MKLLLLLVFFSSVTFADTVEPVDYVTVPGSTDIDVILSCSGVRADADGNTKTVELSRVAVHIPLPLTAAKIQKAVNLYAFSITSTAATHDAGVAQLKALGIKSTF